MLLSWFRIFEFVARPRLESLYYFTHILGRIDGFPPFSRARVWNKNTTASTWIWTTNSIMLHAHLAMFYKVVFIPNMARETLAFLSQVLIKLINLSQFGGITNNISIFNMFLSNIHGNFEYPLRVLPLMKWVLKCHFQEFWHCISIFI